MRGTWQTEGNSGSDQGLGALLTLAGIALVVVAVTPIVLAVFHILTVAAEGVGFTVMAGAIGFLWWKMRQLRQRREDDRAARQAMPRHQAAAMPIRRAAAELPPARTFTADQVLDLLAREGVRPPTQ